jgi:tetratricopeptide (TPR) repeat protein
VLAVPAPTIRRAGHLDARRKIAEAFFRGTRTADSLLVLGYSCSDVFDLATWVPQISRRLTVIYINHRTGTRIANTAPKGDNARARKMFHGHILHIVDCDTDSLAGAIGRHLGFSFASRKSPTSSWRDTLRECIRDFTGFTLAKVRGNLYYVFQDYNKSLLCHQESLSHAKSDLERLIAARNIGFSHYRLSRFNEALSVMSSSLRLARRLREHVHEANILMNIASCYADNGRYALSLRYYMDALSIAEHNRLLREKCFILGNVGLMYAYAGRYTDSLKYTRQGISLARQLGEVETEGKFHANVGEAYLNTGQWRRAMQATRIAINIGRDIGDRHGEVNRRTNLLIAELKSGTKDMRQCLSEAQVLLQESMDIGNDLYTANCHQLIGDCHLSRSAKVF